MQGTVSDRDNIGFIDRFIPAYAGNGLHDRDPDSLSTVHPRVCRERPQQDHKDAETGGSSPRMQGTDCGCNRLDSGKRFIPAYAGNGGRSRRTISRNTVHPRVCRERRTAIASARCGAGSSPRMQGTVSDSIFDGISPRFIPAYAGNGVSQRPHRPDHTVHPRVCRERQTTVCKDSRPHGSSPRMQGTAAVLEREAQRQRFIPAYAGNGPITTPPT